MTKIVNLQPAKAGQTVTVTDSQGRSFQAEAVGDISEGKGILFVVDGKYKVVGNSSQTQRERTMLDRRTPKKRIVTTSYIKLLSYKETETEYEFYISGDRSPELIFSISIDDTIQWGSISTNSQDKNDWVVGILYYDDDAPIILEEKYCVGDLSYLLQANPVGFFGTGLYKLAVITSSSVVEYSASEYGNILEYLRSSGGGVFGNYEIDVFINNENLNFGNFYPYQLYDYEYDEQLFNWGDLLAETDWRNYIIHSCLRPSQLNTAWGETCGLILASSEPSAIENIGYNMATMQSFDGWITFPSDLADFNINSYCSSYNLLQNNVSEMYGDPEALADNFEIISIDSGLEDFLLDLTWDQGTPINNREYPSGSFWLNLGALSPTTATYVVNLDKQNLVYPNHIYNYHFLTSGSEVRLINLLNQNGGNYGLFGGKTPGSNLDLRKRKTSNIVNLAILGTTVVNNNIDFSDIQIYCKANTSYFTSDFLSTIETGKRQTQINRTIVSETIDLKGITSLITYNAFRYAENDTIGYRVDYNIATLSFYDTDNSLIIAEYNQTKIATNSSNIVENEKIYSYWNGQSLLTNIVIPDENEYYIELKKGKLNGITISDLTIEKKEIYISQWSVGEELGTPTKVKSTVKGYLAGGTILSASFAN